MLRLVAAFTVAHAQIYAFEDETVPGNRSLHFMYAFYIYSYEDAPMKSDETPFVKYKSLVAHSTSPTLRDDSAGAQAYVSLQMSIIRYRDFWDLIDPNRFCSTIEDINNGLADNPPGQLMVRKPVDEPFRSVNVYRHTVRFASDSPPVDKSLPVRSSGVYVLVFSNCGDIVDATVSGSVVVKNSYGFLPGNEYHKLPFYGWLSIAYVALAVVWTVLSLRWWKELFPIQNCIAVVILFSLLESFFCYICLTNWNHTGLRSRFLFVVSILLGVVKTTFSYMLVLVASLGWGVTRPFLDSQVVFRIRSLSFLYILLDFVREVVLSFRHSHALSLAFVLLCLLPVSLLNGVIFYWVFTALSNLMETLSARRQTEKLVLFQRLSKILVFALTVATVAVLYHIFTLSRSVAARWRQEWLFTDGIVHLIFLTVLLAMMFLLAPHKASQRYAYSQQVDAEAGDADNPEAIWADEDDALDDEADGESFWATTTAADRQGNMDADTIGARDQDEDKL